MKLSEFLKYVTEGIAGFFDVLQPKFLINSDLNILNIFSGAPPPSPQIFCPGALPGRDPPAPEPRGKK